MSRAAEDLGSPSDGKHAFNRSHRSEPPPMLKSASPITTSMRAPQSDCVRMSFFRARRRESHALEPATGLSDEPRLVETDLSMSSFKSMGSGGSPKTSALKATRGVCAPRAFAE